MCDGNKYANTRLGLQRGHTIRPCITTKASTCEYVLVPFGIITNSPSDLEAMTRASSQASTIYGSSIRGRKHGPRFSAKDSFPTNATRTVRQSSVTTCSYSPGSASRMNGIARGSSAGHSSTTHSCSTSLVRRFAEPLKLSDSHLLLCF